MFQSDEFTLSMNLFSTTMTVLKVTYAGDCTCWVETESGDGIGLLAFEFWLGDTFKMENGVS